MPADVPNTRLFNFVDNPAIISYSAFGDGQVQLDPQVGGNIDVSEFRRVNVQIGTTIATSFSLFMGKIAGSTLSVERNRPLDYDIHTFDVVGPEIALWLRGGPPSSSESVQLWVFLTS